MLVFWFHNWDFNPHSREGSDCGKGRIRWAKCHFNPHSREGSDFYFFCHFFTSPYFNPHSREGSDRSYCGCKSFCLQFQSTLPRREWQCFYLFRCWFFSISIHTPAKGVTVDCMIKDRCPVISIHTPAKGVTLDNAYKLVEIIFQSTLPRREWRSPGTWREWIADFNPHSREGSDNVLDTTISILCNISIHTPAKGVTPFSTNYGCGFLISIHTPAKGVTRL